MAEVRWTREAERWLSDIHEYISADNLPAAGEVVRGIFEKAQILRDFPQMGQLFRAGDEGEIRILLYGHYRIAYLLQTSGIVDILGVFHDALEIDRYLP